MALFGKKKSDKEKCGCSGDVRIEHMGEAEAVQSGGISVKILGSGCKKCNQLEAAAKAALAQLGIDAPVGHITDFAAIAAYGVMTAPALVIDEKVVSAGKVLRKDEIVVLFEKYARQ